MENDKVQKVIGLIQQSALDETIKDILIRDLKSEGITDFMREQIRAYCLEGLKQLNDIEREAKKLLEEQSEETPQV